MDKKIEKELKDLVKLTKEYILQQEKIYDRKPFKMPRKITIKSLEDKYGKCRRCSLGEDRTHLVFGSGNPKAKLVLIGEAPGRQEDLKGLPFVGQAGKLLDKILIAIGLRREDIYITNILKCRPPNNRDPRPDEINLCQEILWEQLEAIKPKIICALGKFAAQTLLGTEEKIGDLRGNWRKLRGVDLMITYHPAYLLRNPQDKRLVWEDMKKLRAKYEKIK